MPHANAKLNTDRLSVKVRQKTFPLGADLPLAEVEAERAVSLVKDHRRFICPTTCPQ
jgi:hypothetical protein